MAAVFTKTTRADRAERPSRWTARAAPYLPRREPARENPSGGLARGPRARLLRGPSLRCLRRLTLLTGLALLCMLQDLAELGRRRADDLGVQPTGLPAQPLQRAGHRHGGHHPAAGPAHRGRHRGDARLALADALRPAASAYRREGRRGELRLAQPAVQPVRLLPREQDLGGRAGLHRQRRADRDGVAQAGEALGRRHADPAVALAPVELRALAGDVAQPGEHRAGRLEQPVLAGGGRQLAESRAEHEPPLQVARDQPVVLQSRGQPVRGGPGEPGRRDQRRQAGRPGLEGSENDGGLVQDADSARVVHVPILPSHAPRRKYGPSQRERTVSRTLAEKVWDAHVVRRAEGEPDLLYVDLHLVHEVTSPQAFDGLRLAGRPVRRPDLTIATEDHNVPTTDIDLPIADPVSRTQVDTLRANCAEFGVPLHSLGDREQGIVHVVGPQLGLTQPGMTVVCGDSHTSTHGAFGALAFGIGTSEVEHVLATQTLPLEPFKTLAVTIDGALPVGVTAKDLILAVIAEIGTGGGQGYVIEYRGEAIRALSMEARMTVCNMSIEAGARAGMIAPDETTVAYLKGRPRAHRRAATGTPRSRTGASCTPTTTPSSTARWCSTRGRSTPFVTWGTNPGQGLPLTASVPDPAAIADERERSAAARALQYMGLQAGHAAAGHRGRHRLPRVVHQRPDRGPARRRRRAARARRSPTACAMLVVPGSVRVRLAGRGTRASTRSSRRPAPSGGTPVARCAWA